MIRADLNLKTWQYRLSLIEPFALRLQAHSWFPGWQLRPLCDCWVFTHNTKLLLWFGVLEIKQNWTEIENFFKMNIYAFLWHRAFPGVMGGTVWYGVFMLTVHRAWRDISWCFDLLTFVTWHVAPWPLQPGWRYDRVGFYYHFNDIPAQELKGNSLKSLQSPCFQLRLLLFQYQLSCGGIIWGVLRLNHGQR